MGPSDGGASDADAPERLRTLRFAAGLTLQAAAQRSGYSVSHLSNVERGVKKATPAIRRAYADFTGEPALKVAQGGAAHEDRMSLRLMSGQRDGFGTRLMRLRLERGWSMRQAARVLAISFQHLANLETGRRSPSVRVAEICDREFVGDGSLAWLAADRSEVNAKLLDGRPPVIGRIQRSSQANKNVQFDDVFREFQRLRAAAQSARASEIFPILAEKAEMLAGCGTAAAWHLAARYAELAGWLAQEAGWAHVVDAWTDAAVRWAARAGDVEMAAYAWERRSLAPFCRGDAATAVALSQRALTERGATPRVRGLALCRVAQCHALGGDQDSCFRAFDQAVALLLDGRDEVGAWGSRSMRGIPRFVEAWCLIDLGRYEQAAHLLGAQPDASLAPDALRSRARYAVRAAMALTGSGDVTQARAAILRLLLLLGRVDSATVGADIHHLICLVNRRRASSLAEFLPDLHNFATGSRSQ